MAVQATSVVKTDRRPNKESRTARAGEGIGNLVDLILGARELQRVGDTHGQDFEPPSDYSFAHAITILAGSGVELAEEFPAGAVCDDGVGGLRFEWALRDRAITLAVPGTEQGEYYIFHEDQAGYSVERNPDSIILTKWLRWLAGASV
jgi:hypothetical protein